MFIKFFDNVPKKYTREFEKYLTDFKIDCDCHAKKQKLYEDYKKNMEWISKNENVVGYSVGETSLTSLDRDKFIAMNKTKYDNSEPQIVDTINELPESIDWTMKDIKYVSPVIQQGECGACWAFTATGVVESAIAINAQKDVVNLSEQQLIDCMPSDYGNAQCEGGVVRNTIQYIKDIGVCLDDHYKYVSGVDCKQNTCLAGECKPCNLNKLNIDYRCSQGEDDLMQQLQKGPVTAIMNSSAPGLQNYTGGIFDIKDVRQRNKYIAPQHGVLVVGYGEENGEQFWKIKNTWGEKWGENGYFRIKRGDRGKIGLLGIALQNCSVTIADPKTI
jgi:C1A family cysteine protease